MSKTFLHKNRAKYIKDLLDKTPQELKDYFDRSNNDWGEFRALKKNKTEKILDKEMKEEIRTVVTSEHIDFDIPEQDEILEQIMGKI